jgi:hypothetical protein
VLALLVDELGRRSRLPGGCPHPDRRTVDGRTPDGAAAADRDPPPPQPSNVWRGIEKAAAHARLRRARSRRPQASWARAFEARLARRARVCRRTEIAPAALYAPGPLAARRAHRPQEASLYRVTAGRDRTRAPDRRSRGAEGRAGCARRLHDLDALLAWGRKVQATLDPPDVALTHARRSCACRRGRVPDAARATCEPADSPGSRKFQAVASLPPGVDGLAPLLSNTKLPDDRRYAQRPGRD